MTKQLWLLAGGNGAGKSTFYRIYLSPRGLKMLSVDEAAKMFEPEDIHSAVASAQKWVDRERSEMLKRNESFCYETVFSHPSKIDFMAEAKGHGYEIHLVYIHLESAELNEARVTQRVSEGGHDVPRSKIKPRIKRTMTNISTAMSLSDTTHILDNSSYAEPFKKIAILEKGKIKFSVNPLPDWANEILKQ